MNGIIRWFANNHVAANLLMLAICVAGLSSALSIKQEVFPEMTMDIITITVPYLGATPTEVEEAICIRVEEKIQGVDGIKKITSSASEGVGTVMVELNRGADVRKALDDIKAEVDRIITFPAETEKPIVSRMERKNQVIDVFVFGDADEKTMKVIAEKVRDDLLSLEDITYTTMGGTRPYEISIEISEEALLAYGLTLGQVTQIVRANSLDLPGGSVKTSVGEILVRTKGQLYTGEEFGKIAIISAPNGTTVTLDMIGDIRDGFQDTDTASFLDGKQSAMVSVFRTGNQGVLEVTKAVKDYMESMEGLMPPGVEIATWHDRSLIYKSRMDLLMKNGAIGLLLVFLSLAITLEFRLALWVSLGIFISFLGAFWVLPWFGVSLNMISMFAFIVSLGLVVDDAIVVGENVYTHRQMGRKALGAARIGTMEVGGPVTFAVLTTIVAFLPLAFVDGTMGKFMYNIPIVVIAILTFSLVESLLILPAHLSTIKMSVNMGSDASNNPYSKFKKWFDAKIQYFINNHYKKTLTFALGHRLLVLSIAMATLLITASWFAGGHIRFTFMPRVDADNLVAALTLPQGTTVEDAQKAVDQLETSLEKMVAEFQARQPEGSESIIRHVATAIGSQPRTNQRNDSPIAGGAHLVEVNAELLPAEIRNIPSPQMARRWREICGPITGAVAVSFSADLFHGGKPVFVQLASSDSDELLAAGRQLKDQLGIFPGVTDISDSFREGKVEMKLSLKPEARTLGLTLADLARQVRRGFYGDEAMRIQRGRDEVKVMVRYPEDERRSLGNLESMRIRTQDGSEVPFSRVARVEIGRGFATIERSDRQRVVSVTADIDQDIANAEEVNDEIRSNIMPDLVRSYPGIRYSMEGQQKDQADSIGSLKKGFAMAMMLIFVLLAVLFKSYIQPAIVMTAIPFGLVGAIWGHVIMGLDLTLISLFGVVALTGVVVNDSLIMIDFINRARTEGQSSGDALINAGLRRFRPIMLTSVTTFAGLVPLILEKSLQAKFLIPMATSLGFGVMFATFITLILVPVSYSLQTDFKRIVGIKEDFSQNEEDDEIVAAT